MRTTPAGESRYSTDATLLHDHGLRVRFTADSSPQYQQDMRRGGSLPTRAHGAPVLSGVSLNVKGPCSKTKPSNELQPGPAAELS